MEVYLVSFSQNIILKNNRLIYKYYLYNKSYNEYPKHNVGYWRTFT